VDTIQEPTAGGWMLTADCSTKAPKHQGIKACNPQTAIRRPLTAAGCWMLTADGE